MAFLFSSFALAAQDYKVTVSQVTIWVKAIDNSGIPVRGLTQADFEVFEDRTKQMLTCFEEIKTAPPDTATEKTSSGSISGKKFVLFLDLYNMAPQEYSLIKPKAKEFLKQLSDRNNEVMLAAMVPSAKLGVVAPFTKDIQRVIGLLEMAKGNPNRDASLRGNEAQIISILQDLRPEGENTVDSLDDLTAHNPDRDVNTKILRNAYQLAMSYSKEENSVSTLSLKALESFGSYLNKLNQQDHAIILYLSGGFNADPGRRYYELIENVAQAKGLSPESFAYTIRVSSRKRENVFDLQRMVRETVGRLNRLNVTIYSISTRGLGLMSSNTAQDSSYNIDETKILPDFVDSLRRIADETGGLSFQNSQNFKVGFDRVLNDLEHQYVLCYSPPVHSEKGKYHEIKVTTKRPNVNLRHRTGYME